MDNQHLTIYVMCVKLIKTHVWNDWKYNSKGDKDKNLFFIGMMQAMKYNVGAVTENKRRPKSK